MLCLASVKTAIKAKARITTNAFFSFILIYVTNLGILFGLITSEILSLKCD